MVTDPFQRLRDKIDDAFLFVLGSSGLLITLFELIQSSEFALNPLRFISVIPLILLGTIWPFYVGYIRGAISTNSDYERIRGWIYYFVGICSYCVFITTSGVENYYTKQIALFFFIFLGLFLSYRMVHFSKNFLNLKTKYCQYAFYATAISAFTFSFLWVMTTNLILDFEGNDIMNMIFSSPELLFWLVVILAILSFVWIFEKGARASLSTEVKLPDESTNFVKHWIVIRGLLIGSNLFDRAVNTNVKVWFLFSQGFIFWVLGSLFWVVKFTIFSQLLLLVSIFMGILALREFHSNVKSINFEGIESLNSAIFGNVLWISMYIILFVITGVLDFFFFAFGAFIITEIIPRLLRRLRKKEK